MTFVPPVARTIVLTGDGAMPYSAALAAYDGTGFLSLATTRSDSTARTDAVPGFLAAAQATIAAIAAPLGA